MLSAGFANAWPANAWPVQCPHSLYLTAPTAESHYGSSTVEERLRGSIESETSSWAGIMLCRLRGRTQCQRASPSLYPGVSLAADTMRG